jgi:AraC-like DNA-binding protein
MSSYREHAPAADLDGLVGCTWERRGATAGEVRVIPDGCVDVVWSVSGGLRLAGPDTGPVVYDPEPGYEATGLRLRPGAAGSVLGIPLTEIRDRRAPLEWLWGRDAALLEERLALAEPGERRRLLEQAVRPLAREAQPDPLVVASLALLGRRESSVAELSRTLALSERALRRRFDRAIGYGPKKLDRIIRFRRFLRRAGPRREANLAETAFELGYADQAHLTRECRRLSGLTPADLLGAYRVPRVQESIETRASRPDALPAPKAPGASLYGLR